MNTDFNPAGIQEGMDVFSTDGDKIGSVSHVYFSPESPTAPPATGNVGDVVVEEIDVATGPPLGSTATGSPASGYGAGTPSGTTATGNAPTTTSTGAAQSGYFRVDQGGILGIGTKELYIPFNAVSSLDPGNCLTVSCTKDECSKLYDTKPAFLS